MESAPSVAGTGAPWARPRAPLPCQKRGGAWACKKGPQARGAPGGGDANTQGDARWSVRGSREGFSVLSKVLGQTAGVGGPCGGVREHVDRCGAFIRTGKESLLQRDRPRGQERNVKRPKSGCAPKRLGPLTGAEEPPVRRTPANVREARLLRLMRRESQHQLAVPTTASGPQGVQPLVG